jgi:hypothetical protein
LSKSARVLGKGTAMGKVIDLASRRVGATDPELFMFDLYEALTRAIDGTVGDPIADKVDLIRWQTELENALDFPIIHIIDKETDDK